MARGILRIDRALDKRLIYTVNVADIENLKIEGPPVHDLKLLVDMADACFASSINLSITEQKGQFSELTQSFIKLLPENLIAAICQWCASVAPDATLLVACEEPELASLPWELLSTALNLPQLFIARLAFRTKTLQTAMPLPLRMLAVGWSHLKGLELPGIDREITQLLRIFSDEKVTITPMSNPSYTSFTQKLQVANPRVLHLATGRMVDKTDDPEIAMAAAGDLDGPPEIDMVSVTLLCQTLEHASDLALVVLNTCGGGLNIARLICERLGATVVGWIGAVDDMLAADFAMFFYQRLAAGSSVIDAMRAFMWRLCGQEQAKSNVMLRVWLPSPESVEAVLLPIDVGSLKDLQDIPEHVIEQAKRPQTIHAFQPGYYTGYYGHWGDQLTETGYYGHWGDQLTERLTEWRHTDRDESLLVAIEFEPEPTINPALLLNRRSPIKRLNINSNHDVFGLRLQILCDTGAGTSSFQRTINLHKGSQPFKVEDICFPALHELIHNQSGRRWINFVISVSSKDKLVVEDTRTSLWMSYNEWMDQEETWPYIPAFVNSYSDAIREIFEKAIEELHKIATPQSAFIGYEKKDPSYVDLQMRAIFQTLRGLPISYINPPGSPIFLEGSYRPSGQVVRLPPEAYKDKRGTCHDLSILLAACAEYVGLCPLIVLVRGHTLTGYWRDAQAFQEFWKRSLKERSAGFGSGWVISKMDQLGTLINDASIQLVEATALTNQQSTYEYSCRRWNSPEKIEDRGFHVAVDIRASRGSIHSI